ncbi:hypothetical protein GCM10009846_25530 [Agrococcus versicolor]|uniref:Tandem-95 repeat protein n=1 Tax=Agrococcus versicolor TaxID=501482 RepID=A0ABP5MLK3_9MICO
MLARRQRPSKLRHGLLVGLVAVLVGVLAAPLVAPPTEAEAAYATGGPGQYADSILWMDWGTISNTSTTTRTTTATVQGQQLAVTCSLSSLTRLRGNAGGNWLTPYTPGGYSGDYLDDLYGGAGAIGLYTQDATTVRFDVSCSATLGGAAFPLDGLVMADAESTNSNEYIRATIPAGATWRILETGRGAACTAQSVLATRTTGNQLTLASTGECGSGSNVAVAYMDGATSATGVEVYGGGRQGIALGVMAGFDHSDAPAGLGTAAHALSNTFSGGTIGTSTTPTRVNDTGFAVAQQTQSTPRLGGLVDAELAPLSSPTALGDDQDGLDDEDAQASGTQLTLTPRQSLPGTFSCTAATAGGLVAGWIDFDRSGTFDADERASGSCGTGGTVALAWTVTDDVASSTSATPTVMRLRIGTTAAMVANPTGVALRGEVEDHALVVTAPQPVASNDARTTPFETATTVPVLENDTTGGLPFRPGSVELRSGSTWVTTLDTEQGRYVVNATTGAVTFTPAAGFVGTTTPVTYRVSDEAGRATTATIAVSVTAPPAPAANDDVTTGTQGSTQTAAVLGNDVRGVASVPLQPSTVRIVDGTSLVTTLVVAGQGTYTVNATTGAIAFAPLADFVGQASGVRYQVADSRGVTATARYTPTVTQVAVDDASTGAQGVAQTIAVLANDGAQGVTLDAATLRIVDPTTGASATTYVVQGQGTYAVRGSTIVFTPVAGFTGAATQLDYRVATTAGATVQATISVVVTPVVPVANADATSGPQGVAQTVDPFANDSSGNAGIALDRGSLTLLNAQGQPVTTVAVAGGTYAVSGSSLVFTPTAAFVGTAPSATYRIANANGTTATSTYAATTTRVTPTAANDVSQGAQGALQRIDPLANDVAGDAAVPLSRATLTLLSGSTAVVELTIANQGTWRVVDGQLTFQPLPGFTGVATSVPYRVADANGTTTTATWTATVQTGVSPDASTGPQGLPQTIAVLANDGADVVPASLRLVDPATGQLVAQLVVAGQGTYRVDAGRILFTPLPAFRGAATPVTYDVEDQQGNHRRTTLAVTVTAVNPAPQPDTTTGPQGVAQSTQPLANDQPGNPGVPLVPGTLTLLDGQGAPVTSLAVAGGTYALSGTTITFTPDRAFVGTPATATYRVADANGTTATSTYAPTFARVTPVAANDAATGIQGLAVSVAPLANDAPGNAAVPLAPGTLTLLSSTGQATDQVTIAGQGVYAIDRSTPTAPRVVFTPALTFVGTATAVQYRVADANGTTTIATVTPTLTAVTPVATADVGSARQGAAVTIAPLANDAAGDARRPLQPTTLALLGANGSAVDELVVAGQGTYRVDRTTPTSPLVRFTPLPTFTGAANPATYRVQDANGTVATATITPTITPVTPRAEDDVASARQGAPASVAVLGNDAPGDAGVPLDPASLRLLDAAGQPTTSVTVAGQGTWSIDRSEPTQPRIVLTPLPTFTGAATPVGYRIADANGTTDDAIVTATIAPVTPTAADDAAATRQGGAVAILPTANDAAGDAAVPLVDGTLALLSASGAPVAQRTVANEGTYAVTIRDDGRALVVFTPVPGFVGPATAVPYRVSDANGTTATARILVTVAAVTPVAQPDVATARQGASVRVDVVANDVAGDVAVPLARPTLALVDAGGAAVDLLVVPGQGVYRVDRSTPASPVLVFTPVLTFSGTATPATYRVADANGTVTTSTLTPTLTPVVPTAAADEGSARQGAPVSVDVLANDAAGDAAVPLVPGSVTLLDAEGATVDELVIAGQGTYAVDRGDADAPRIVFTPVPTFVGVATPATYRVADANGTRATATVTPTIGGVTPTAADDVASARQGAPASVAVLANDAAGDADVPLDPASVTLLDAAGQPAASVAVDGGTYTLDTSVAAAPRVVFTPDATFVGTPDAVRYRVADANGTTATATVTPTIVGVTPVAVDDVASARQGARASVDPLANDLVGDADVPLDPTSLTLLDADGAPVAAVEVEGGTYAVDASGATPRIVFTPQPSFSGEAPAARYRVADENGTTTTALVVATIGAVTPIARPDAGSARQGAAATIDALANDAPGDADVPLDGTSLALVGADGQPTDSVVVAGQGTWTVDRADEDAPVLVFTPAPAFAGIATAVPYRVLDANGTQATSTATATIGAVLPLATDDAGTARQGATVTIDALANDAPGDAEVPLDPATLVLLDGDAEVLTLEVAGQGTWTVEDGEDGPRLVFASLPAFVGTAAVDYRVRDANGTPADATARATLEAVTPIAAPDAGDGRQGAPVTIDALANDEPGDADVPLALDTLALVDADGAAVDALTVDGEGTWSVDRAGETPVLVFTPIPSFSGLTTAVPYRVLDANGTAATSTAVAAIAPVTPLAANDVASGRQGASASVAVLANDARGDAAVALDPATLTLLGTDGQPAATVVIDGQGTYAIDRATPTAPRVVFTPIPSFTGTATGVTYRVADANGTTTTATVTPTIDAVTPTAEDDTASARQGATVTIDALANDQAGDAEVPLDASTLALLDGQGAATDELVVAEGTWRVDRSIATAPVLVLTPRSTFVGTTVPVGYRVLDANGTPATAIVTAVLGGVTPVATADEASARQGAPVSVAPLANDRAGDPDVPLVPGTLVLLDAAGAPATQVVVDGGRYEIDASDAAAPRIVFTPAPSLTGPATPVAYRVADANGTAVSSTFTPTLTAVTPVAVRDRESERQGLAVVIDALANDLPGHPDVPLVPSSLTLLDGAGQSVDRLEVAERGTWTVDRTIVDAPVLVFTPLPSFAGRATGVDYAVLDANGTRATNRAVAMLEAVTPVAAPDQAAARQGAPAFVAPLANDVAGHPDVPLDATTLTLLDAAGAPAATVAVAGGSYALTSVAGVPTIVFTPEATFVGTAAPVTYRVADGNGTTTSSTFTPTIAGVEPVAAADGGAARQGASVTVSPLANDVAGLADVPLDGATFTLLDADGQPVGDELAVAGVGTWSVDRTDLAAPRVTFAPERTFTGDATIRYGVRDGNGTLATATITATIAPVLPDADPDFATARQGAPAEVAPLANDDAGHPDVPLDAESLVLLDDDAPVDEVVVSGQGTYAIDRSQAAPRIVFTPLPTFVGVATAVTYRVADANGTVTSATFTPTIAGVTPTARPDAGSARQGAVVAMPVLANDAAGDAAVPLVPGSLVLLGADDAVVDRVVVDGGTYAIDASGATPVVTFTPDASFVGTAVAVRYRVADANGTTATALATPTLVAVTPTAAADAATARQGARVVVEPLANDAAGDVDVPLDATTLTLLDGELAVDAVRIPGQGTYAIERDGDGAPRIVFTPEPTFVGPADAVRYRVADANGTTATSTVAATLTAVTPVANADAASGRQGSTVSVAPLANDVQGHPDVPLVPATLTLVDAAGVAVDVLVVADGSYAIDRTIEDAPRIVFTPSASLVGPATPAGYRIADANGTAATSTFTPTLVGVTPVASPDSGSARQGASVSLAVLANDVAGDPAVALDPATLRLVGADDALVEELVVAEGTWTIDRSIAATPRIVFTPVPTFAGPVPVVAYDVADANGTRATSTVTVTIDAVTPVAVDDVASARQGAEASVAVLANDRVGDPQVPLAPETLTLLDAAGAPAATVTIPGQGTYRVDASTPSAPRVVFAPIASFAAEATPVTYRVADANGTTTTATVTPTIGAVTPVANPDAAQARQGATVTIDAVADDRAGIVDVPLAPETLTLLDGVVAVDELVIDGQGTWRVDRRVEDAPVLVFSPLPTFVGASTVAYRVADANGTSASSTATATLVAVTPVAADDVASARQGATASVAVLTNDAAGDPDVPLERDTLTLVDAAGAPVETIAVEGQGTWSIDRANLVAPRVAFAPVPTYVGTPDAVRYQVADANGTLATALVVATIAPVTPIAVADAGEARQGASVTLDVLDDDRAGDPQVPLAPDTLEIVGAEDDELVVASQGTWSVDRSGSGAPVLVFVPLPTFAGTSTVDYRVADANGTIATTTATAVITPVTPVAVADVARSRQGAPASVAPLANDTAGDAGVPLDPATLELLDADGVPQATLAIVGQGTYAIERAEGGDPVVVFTPEPAFAGTADAVRYRVADANGTIASSTVTAVVVAVTPVARDDVATGRQGARVDVAPLVNDAAGDADVPLVPSTLRLVGAAPDGTVTVAAGTYAIDVSNADAPRIVFTPAASFVGVATPVTYGVADANGTIATATFTPTLTAVTPVADPDAATGLQGGVVRIAVLANDDAGLAEVPLDPSTLTLLDATGAPVTELEIAGEGTWTVDLDAEGGPFLVLATVPTFTGDATTVAYRVRDANGTAATAVVDVTIDAVTPIATDDAGAARQGAPVTIDVVADDLPGHPDVPIVAASLTLLDAAGVAVDVLLVGGQGTWSVDRTDVDAPVLVFAPLPTFSGQSSVAYRIADANGTTDAATASATIGAVTPIAQPDAGTARQGATVTIDATANDDAGDAAVPLDRDSLVLLDAAGAPTDELVVDGEGTWTVVHAAGVAPVLAFEPLPSFAARSSVTYRVLDANGTPATSTAAATLAPVVPNAIDDAVAARQGAPASVVPLANDVVGHPDVPLDAATLTLLDAAGEPTDRVTIPGQGTYAIDATTEGGPRIVFTPEAAFAGVADAVTYRVADANGTTDEATVTATITGVEPVAVADAAAIRQGATATVAPLGNDLAGLGDVPLDATTLVLLDGDEPVADELVVPGVGTWSIDRSTPTAPTVTFAPVATFTGTAAIGYVVRDANGTRASATIAITVTPVSPVAADDLGGTEQGVPTSIDVLANDVPGHPDVPLAAATLTLLDGDEPVDRLFVDGEGTWRIDRTVPASPTIVLEPAAGFRGETTPVAYRVLDANGTPTTAQLVVDVAPVVPDAVDDVATARQGAPISVAPLANDVAGSVAVPLVPATLVLLDAAGRAVDVVMVAGQGSYAIDARIPDAPRIVFTPVAGFSGPADGVDYRVSDANGTTAEARFTPTATPVAPIATADSGSARQGAPASVAVLSNDGAGHPDVPLVPSTLTLVDAAGAAVAEIVVEQGTWSVDRSDALAPRVVFTPIPAFAGTPDPVAYRVADANGTTVSSTVTVAITPVTPIARDDEGTARQGATVAVAPLANDVPGAPGVALVPGSLTLLDAAGERVEELDVPGVGRWTIDRAGTTPRIVFASDPTFVGTAVVEYAVADVNGTWATAAIVIANVTPVTPVATGDEGSALQGSPVRIAPLVNDAPGDPAVPLAPATLALLDAAGASVDTLVVDREGTWTIDRSDLRAPVLVFTPLPSFTGEATPVTYVVADANGTRASATVAATVDAVTPIATPDSGAARQGAAVRVDVLANDAAGDPTVPLDEASLTLLDASGAAVASLVVDGEGTWSIDRSGEDGPVVVFTPLPSFDGVAARVDYRIADVNGTTATSTVGATIGAIAPIANGDLGTGRQGAPVTVDVLANDVAGDPDVPLDAASLQLVDGTGAVVASIVVEGAGTWTVDRTDPAAPVLVFTPLAGYASTTPPVAYVVADANGTTATSTARATLTAVVPRAIDDTTTGAERTTQSVDPLANDLAGDDEVPLVPSTLTLLDAAGEPATIVVVGGEGTYALVDGRIVFTPAAGFVGTAVGVAYRVADANGTLASGRYAPEVTEGATEIVADIVVVAPAGTPVTVDPATVAPGLVGASVRILDPLGAQVTRLVVAGEGVWTVDTATGRITFTPEAGFVGDPTPVEWTGVDAEGTSVAGEIRIAYEAGPVDPSVPPVDPSVPPVDPSVPPVDPSVPPTSPSAPPAVGGDDGTTPGVDLPRTGAQLATWLLLAALLAIAAGLLMGRRRRG